jgi:hypothetical protein
MDFFPVVGRLRISRNTVVRPGKAVPEWSFNLPK